MSTMLSAQRIGCGAASKADWKKNLIRSRKVTIGLLTRQHVDDKSKFA